MDSWAQIRPQFDALPYPNIPLERKPGDHPTYLSLHSYAIPYYWRYHRVVDTQGKWILDAGCGSGYKAMALAAANPGAHIVGVDISSKSVELAQQRVKYHGVANPTEFHCLPLEELPNLGQKFDYITCDETLSLLPDPPAGLAAMQAVLKPDGILRVNLHSVMQRTGWYRMQAFFGQFSELEQESTDSQIELVRQTMRSLEDWVTAKRSLWKPNPQLETDPEFVAANVLLRGDKGYTMLEFAELLRHADLELISMVNWREWNLEKLFKSIEDLPIAIAFGLADMSLEQQLHTFELLNPVHRLLDLYCGHPGRSLERSPLADWTVQHWQTATVHLHPQLCTPAFENFLIRGIEAPEIIALEKFFPVHQQTVHLDAALASCLLALIQLPLTMPALCDRWLKIHPVDPITLDPMAPEQAFATMRQHVIRLEAAGYLMVELAAS
jgi:ubiquinone/menaquinone biosynthesis C-methylase UbiE